MSSCGRYASELFVFQNTTWPSTFVFSYTDNFFVLSPLPYTQTYLATITGPTFHSIAPDSLCFVKPKLTTLTHYFNLLAKQYPTIATGLHSLVAN